jgi:3-deoxy-D-arabino-heptulosonate 7-phosphate (DAHP) synthase
MPWLDVLGAGLQAYATIYAAEKQEDAGEYAADAAEDRADYLKQMRERKLEKLSKDVEGIVSAERALYAKAGVKTSSATVVEAERHTRSEAELDAEAIRQDAEYEVTRLYDVAGQYRRAGEWQARATLISGLATMTDIIEPYYYRYID